MGGNIATLILMEGTLKIGDVIVIGDKFTKIKLMSNDQGKRVIIATPAIPVYVHGFNDIYDINEKFIAVKDDKIAKRIISLRTCKKQSLSNKTNDYFLKKNTNSRKIIVKSDSQSSMNIIINKLDKYKNLNLDLLSYGIGNVK